MAMTVSPLQLTIWAAALNFPQLKPTKTIEKLVRVEILLHVRFTESHDPLSAFLDFESGSPGCFPTSLIYLSFRCLLACLDAKRLSGRPFGYSIERGPSNGLSDHGALLLWKPDAAHQVPEPWVGAQRIKSRRLKYQRIKAFLVSLFEQGHRSIVFP